MGYWNGWYNFADWAERNGYIKKRIHCGANFLPKSGNQKYCSREQSPACNDDRYFEKLWKEGKHPLQLNG